MSIRRPRPLTKGRLRHRDKQRKQLEQIAQRKMLLEKLEERQLLAGAQLIGIQPSDGELLDFDGLTELNVAPRDLTFRFDESQQFPTDPEGIRIRRAGEDLLLGTADDIIVTPGFLGPKDAPNENEIVARFASTLVDDVYRVEIFSQDVPGEGIGALRNINGEPFSIASNEDRFTVDFRLNLGAKILSVVPQPIVRDPATGDLTQQDNVIQVFFNDDDLGPSVLENRFYQLILTNDTIRNTDDGEPILPTNVAYDADLDLVTLTFAQDLYDLPGVNGEGTFRLRIGTDEVPAAAPIRTPSFEGASDPAVDFQIDLVFPDDSLSPRQQEIIRGAADRWEEIIVGDLPNVGLIDDIELTVVSEFRDGVGHFLAHGLPTNLREDSLLPYQGRLVLDLYDVINLQALEDGAPTGNPADNLGTITYDAADLTTVATREIGKALGFGSLWQEHGLILDVGEVDPNYIGVNAVDEFNTLFNVSDFRIPVEVVGDAQGADNPRDEHWRETDFEAVLQNELMTGFLSDTDPNFISRITVGAMEDLGYVVDYAAADAYDTTSPQPFPATAYVAPPVVTPANDPGDSFDTAADVEVHFETGEQIEVTGDGTAYTDGTILTVNGQKFEFVDAAAANGQADVTAIALNYDSSVPTTAAAMAAEIAGKITGAPAITVTANASGTFITLAGDTSIDLGVATGVGLELVTTSVVIPASLDPQFYPFDLPGWIDEPGVRTTEYGEHTEGDRQDFTDEIATIYYNFKEHYGFDVQGNPLSNVITPQQIERAREVFELYGQYLGVQFVETDNQGITIVTGDLRAVRPTVPTGPGDALGISGGGIAIMDNSEVWNDDFGGNWFQEAMRQIGQTLGLGWAYELPVGTILGDPAATGNDSRVEPVFPGSYDVLNGQIVYRPQQKDIDIYRFVIQESGTFVAETFAERLANSSSADTVLTLYQVVTDDIGNVVLDHNGEPLKQLIARNDDYYSEDSLLSLDLTPGEYFIGVSSTGNENYDPGIEDSGFGGTTEGDYELRMTFRPQADASIEDDTRVAFDGDADNRPGGVYNFWFRVAEPLDVTTHTIDEPAVVYVDKSNQVPVGQPQPTGELLNPFNKIPDALSFIEGNRASQLISLSGGGGVTDNATFMVSGVLFEFVDASGSNAPTTAGFVVNYDSATSTDVDIAAEVATELANAGITATAIGNKVQMAGSLTVNLGATATGMTLQSGRETTYILRLVGNGGDDGLLETQNDNIPYELGFEPPFNVPLEDGASLDVPQGVTVMIDQGAIFKNSLTSINVGSESSSVDRSGGAVQVLGAPYLLDSAGVPILDGNGDRVSGEVYFTSWNNDGLGADTNPNTVQTPSGGDWGGLLFRNDQETVNSRFDYQTEGIFLNYVNHANISYGGGKVVINSVQQSIDSIHLIEARPTVSYNTITFGAGSAISADPNSFLETNFHNPLSQFDGAHTSDYSRIGPDIHDNSLAQNNNNALEVRIDTLAGNEVTELEVSARFDDTDIPHTLTQNLIIQGTPGGEFLETTAPSVTLVTFTDPGNVGFNGTLAGNYEYALTFVDAAGNESPPSAVTPAPTDNPAVVTASANGLIQLNGLPPAPFGTDFIGRRVYRSVAGANTFQLVATINSTDTTYIDRGQAGTGLLDLSVNEVTGIRRARLDASLVIDPGTVVKIEGSRIEASIGTQLIAEGVDGREIIFTSRHDDRYGGSGTFDTNNDDNVVNEAQAAPGNWSGIVFGPVSTGSLDHVLVTFGGGIGNIGGSSAAFNAIEIHQAEQVRVANSVIRANEIGQGGQDGQPDSDRFGQGFNAPAAIFVRGSQPILVKNIIADNVDTNVIDPFGNVEVAAISIDVNSLNGMQVFDPGRSTGFVDAFDQYIDNLGPLVRENMLSGNGLNGMDIRGGVLTTEGAWDDTDIQHLLRAEIVIPNFQTFGGLRLESSATESLVVKLESQDPNGFDANVPDVAGFTVTGEQEDYQDRIGGMLHVIGQPGHPVILTSISDDTVGAGFRPDGTTQHDVRDDASTGTPGDWRSILIDEFSYDNNVDINQELFEAPDAAAPGINATPGTAQFLGSLAPNTKSGDESLRLGFIVNGFLNDPQDIDVYSFQAQPGTEVWLDIDRSTHSLDSVIELVDALGQVIARSDNSLDEGLGDGVFQSNPNTDANVLQKTVTGSKDHWTTNPRDAGLRVVVPGTPVAGGEPGTYHVRVRSSNPGIAGANAALLNGETSGMYQLQIRLTEQDEIAGSTVRYADIRYATRGIEIFGQPAHSPIQSEAVEILNGGQTSDTNDVAPQSLGNLANQDVATISVAGTLGVPERPGFAGDPGENDLDWYRFDIAFEDLQEILDTNRGGEPLNSVTQTMPVTFDLDYADGFSRANTIVSVYNGAGVLILTSLDSSVADDRPAPLEAADVDDLSRGSIGPLDPWIGPVELGEGSYYVVVSSVARIPQELRQFQTANPEGGLASQVTRLEPISSIQRIVDEDFEGHDTRGGDTDNDFTFVVSHDDQNEANLEKFLPSTTDETEAINLLDQLGGSNILGTQVEVLIDDESPVDWHLGDVAAYVTSGNTFTVIDPFTGATEANIGGHTPVRGITITDRNIRALTTPTSGPIDDATSADFVTLDTGNGATLTNVEDTLVTYRPNPGDPNDEDLANVGYQFEAITQGDGHFFMVGNRTDVGGLAYGTNVVYRYGLDGVADGGTLPDRTVGNRHRGAGTQVREVGQVLTHGVLAVAPGGGTASIEVTDFDGTVLTVGFTPDQENVAVTADDSATLTAAAVPAAIQPGWGVTGLAGVFNATVVAVTPTTIVLDQPIPAQMTNATFVEPGALGGLLANWIATGGLPNYDLGIGDEPGTLHLTYTGPGSGEGYNLTTSNLLTQGITAGGLVGSGGTLTAMAFVSGDLYTLSDEGGVFRISDADRDSNAPVDGRQVGEFLFNVMDEAGVRIPFGGADRGPVTDVLNYSELIFGAGGGRLYAFDATPDFGANYRTSMEGQLEPIFFDGQTSVPVAATRGFAFSTLSTNQWGGAGGNEREQTFDFVRNDTVEPTTPTGAVTPGYGFTGHNFAGGAHGSVVTNPFSLEGYSSADQPHLYFDYVLDTIGQGSSDSFRVFVSTDGGDWELLVSNFTPNLAVRDAFEVQEAFDNTNSWRQVRVPLGDFAGLPDLRLRFDFATAGTMEVGDLLTTGDELRALPGPTLRDEQTFVVTDNNQGNVTPVFQNGADRFEVDLGYTLVAPSGAKLQHGWTFEVDGVTYEFLDDAQGGAPIDKFAGAPSNPANIPIPFDAGMTAAEVAERIQIAVENNFVPRVFGGVAIDDSGRDLGWNRFTVSGLTDATSNDTLKHATDTGLYFGEGTYTASATIGDNPFYIPVAMGGLLTEEFEAAFSDKGAEDDVDIYKLRVNERATIDVVAALAAGSGFFDFVDVQLLDADGVAIGASAASFLGPGTIQHTDTIGRATRTAPQHSDAIDPRDIDPYLESPGNFIVEEGVYYVVVSTTGGDYLPDVDNSADGIRADVDYNLTISVSNTDKPVVNYVAPAVGEEAVFGDDRIAEIDREYAFINAHRNDNRVNIPYAVNIAAPFSDVAAPNTPLARFVEGTPGGFVDVGTSNVPIMLHSGMTSSQVADAISHTLADVYQNGDRRLVKGDDGLVRVIAHSISAIDLGQTGNTIGAIAQTKFGYTGDFNGQRLPGDFVTRTNTQAQGNTGAGIRIDNIIVGFAERGEQVINSSSTNRLFVDNAYTTDEEVTDGSYQLEIRPSTDHQVSIFSETPFLTGVDTKLNALYRSFDTNTRFGNFVSLEIPSGADIVEGQTFTISDGLATVTFEYDDLDFAQLGSPRAGVAAGNVRIGFRDFESADLIAERVRDAINSPQVQGNAALQITAALSDGTVTGTGSTSNVVDLFGNAIGSLPSGPAWDPYDFGDVTAIVHDVEQERRAYDTRYGNDQIDVYHEDISITGDSNVERRQGQVIVTSNFISHSEDFAVFVTAGARDGAAAADVPFSDNPHAGPTANQVVLNTENLVPGVVISNNVLSFNGAGGIHFSGESPFVGGQLAPIPLGRIVNNTIFGSVNRNGVGINVDDNAGPTLLNNLLSNLTQGIVVDNTSIDTTVISGSLYYNNVNNIGGSLNTLGDFFLDVPATEPMFVDAANGNFYLDAGSLAIDSSVASTDDREFLRSVRQPLGIAPSPIIAPDRDVTGQLRVDDQTVSTPAGQGENTSVDRGAFDRSDTEGPTAILINPFDNDGFNLDIDPTGSVVFRPDSVFNNFRIQLIDGLSVGSQVDGVGIDDLTVVDRTVTITQDGEFLQQGVDYTFSYDPTSDFIQLTPLSGIWEADATYVITLNNRDRYVMSAVSGQSVVDGDQFVITDTRGGDVVFEYESGYTLNVLPTLSMQVPLAGATAGGVGDGNTFEIVNGTTSVVFELDTNATLNDPVNHIAVPFNAGDDVDAVADAVVRAIASQSAILGLSPSYLGDGRVHVGGTANHSLVVNGTGLSGETHVSNLAAVGNASSVKDLDSVTITVPGRAPVIFEFDLDGSFTPGTTRVPFRLADPFEEIAGSLAQVITNAGLGITATDLGNGSVHLGGVPGTTVDVVTDSNLTLDGEPGVTTNLRLEIPVDGGAGIPDNLSFTLDLDGTLRTFEFDNNGLTNSGNQIITINQGGTVSTQDEVADRVVLALANEGLPAANLGDGIVEIQATTLQRFSAVPGLLNPSGVPGGAVPVVFVPRLGFTEEEMAISILAAIDQAKDEGKLLSTVVASLRGGNTIFLEGLDDPTINPTVFSGISAFYLEGIKDLATNDLKPNQVSEETRFTILLGDIGLDYGDAPNGTINSGFRYPTVLTENGARHVVYDDNPLFLGHRVDVDQNGAPSALADGDDLEANALPFDFSGTPSLGLGATVTPFTVNIPELFFVEVPAGGGLDLVDGDRFTVSNTSTGDSVTFEFDNNGGLSDGTFTAIPFNSGSTDVGLANDIVTLLTNAGLGLTPVAIGEGRVHLGSTAVHTLTAVGSSFASGGAAFAVSDEDTFVVTTANGPVTFEFDSNFDTTDSLHIPVPFDARSTHEDIANTIVDTVLAARLGVTPIHMGGGTIEMDGDDEDGVTLLGALNSNLLTPIEVIASDTGLLDAWIDFNGDGDFSDTGEKIFNSVRLVPGVNALTISTPVTAVAGDTFARFRFSDLGGLGPNGLASSGEVEDYAVTIRAGNPPVAGNDPGTGTIAITEDEVIAPAGGDVVGPNLLANDIDPDTNNNIGLTIDGATPSVPLTITSDLGAIVTLFSNGNFTYDGTSIANSPNIQALDANDVVNDTFTYRATDGFLFSQDATVTIQVTGMNDAPTVSVAGGNNEFQVFEDGVFIVGEFPATDIDGNDNFQNLVYNITQGPEGIATSNGDGTFTFSPNPINDYQDLNEDQLRQTVFTFTATDTGGLTSGDDGGQAVGSVTVNVRGVNDIPTVSATGIANVDLNTAGPYIGDFLGNDADQEDTPATLTYSILAQPGEGSFTVDPGDPTKFFFDPTGFFTDLGRGETRTVTGTYTATDSRGAVSFSAPISATVSGRNDAPIANPDPSVAGFYSTNEDTPLLITGVTSGVLFNDTDPDGDTLEVVPPPGHPSTTAPFEVLSNLGATVTLNANGTFTYDPRTSATLQAMVDGSPVMVDTFTYYVTDNDIDTVPVSSIVEVRVSGLNDAPNALDFTMGFDGGDGGIVSPPALDPIPADNTPVKVPFEDLTGLDPDGGGTTFTFTVVPGTGPSEGRVLPRDSNGDYFFDPRPVTPLAQDFLNLPEGQIRLVEFGYRVEDQTGLSSTQNGIVTVQVVGVNDAPTGVVDNAVNEVGTSIEIDLVGNDFDIDSGDTFRVLNAIEAPGTLQAANGTVSAPDANGNVTYTPNSSTFTGVDTFTYRIQDALGLESANILVTVTTTVFPDTGADGPVTTFELEPVDIDVLANDSDPDGNLIPASVTVVGSGPSFGSVVIDDTTGVITYTSVDIDFVNLGVQSVTDTFQYTVTDNVGAVSDPTTITVEVVPNDRPFQNPRNNLDVNADTFITPFDMLLVLTHLQTKGNALPETPPPPYVDVNGDNIVTPTDLRLLLEVLNTPGGQGEGPEGEAGSLNVTDLSALFGPTNVSLQHSSVADPSLAREPQTLVDEDTSTTVLPTADQLRDVTADSIELDYYLDDIATETRKRLTQEAVDDALIDLLMEGE